MTDKERIKKFISVVEKLKSSTFLKNAKTLRYELNFSVGQPITQKVSGFDEDQFRSMLMDLRKLTLPQDKIELVQICDLIIQNTTRPDIISNITACKDIYRQLMDDPMAKMIINGQAVKSAEIIKLWLYGHYSHEDENKATELKSLGLATELHKYNFVAVITQLLKLSIIIANNALLLNL
jgi:hypothetical protein